MNHSWNARRFAYLIVFIIIAQLAGIIGTVFTFDAIPTWYASLVRPSFAPPNWVFGPVWTILYTLMGIAAFFAWEARFHKTQARRALTWYWIQLALNAVWSPIFFGLQNLGLALVVIALLWLSILMMLREFFKFDKRFFAILLPYLAWVSFASVLNYYFWILN